MSGDAVRDAAAQVAAPSAPSQTGNAGPDGLGVRQAYITAYDVPTKTVSIKFPESTQPLTGVSYLGSYAPQVNDTVWVAENGPDHIVLGTQAQVASNPPVGTMAFFKNVTQGWLYANGQSTTGYPALAAAVGANVPNIDGRVPAGNGFGGGGIGATGGVSSVTLSLANLPVHAHPEGAHQHTQVAHSHTTLNHAHTVQGWLANAGTGGNIAVINNTGGGGNNGVTNSDGGAAPGTNTDGATNTGAMLSAPNTGNAGTGTSFSILPPYYVAYWLIKH